MSINNHQSCCVCVLCCHHTTHTTFHTPLHQQQQQCPTNVPPHPSQHTPPAALAVPCAVCATTTTTHRSLPAPLLPCLSHPPCVSNHCPHNTLPVLAVTRRVLLVCCAVHHSNTTSHCAAMPNQPVCHHHCAIHTHNETSPRGAFHCPINHHNNALAVHCTSGLVPLNPHALQYRCNTPCLLVMHHWPVGCCHGAGVAGVWKGALPRA